jgi:phosphatidylglycerophosphatase A
LRKFPEGFFKHPAHLAAFGFGSGCSPKAPGTVGTLMAVLLYLPMQDLSLAVFGCVIVLSFLLGLYFCQKASDALGVHDHGGIVWDEFVGFWITMIAAPSGWQWLVLGFCLFRLFDIWKPQPIAFLDKHISGGLGIMLDDVMAGIYALLSLQLIYFLWSSM